MAPPTPWFWFKVALFAFVLAIGMNFLWWVATHPEGTIHHGIVGEEVCQGVNNYILIDFGNGSTHVYSVLESATCLDFLYHHRQGVTLQDDAWQNRIAWYKFDGVAK